MSGTQESQLSRSAPIANLLIGTPLESQCEARLNRVWIYGLFNTHGVCRYVGQTKVPYLRSFAHRSQSSGPEKNALLFRVFRSCEVADANRLEVQIIRAFKRKCQCDLNKSFAPFNRNKHSRTPRIYSARFNRSFLSVVDAALFFDVSTTTIRNYAANRNNHNPDGLSWCV
jgi:hypothetical protein